MPARVISSLGQGDGAYFLNMAILQEGEEEGEVKLRRRNKWEGIVYYKRHGRVYDFVRSARAKIRETVANYLTRILPGIDEDAKQDLQSAFENLFNYYDYKKNPFKRGRVVEKSLRLLISKEEWFWKKKDYVAHVDFTCETTKVRDNEYEVYAWIICDKFTWFELQETTEQDIVDVLREGLKCLSI